MEAPLTAITAEFVGKGLYKLCTNSLGNIFPFFLTKLFKLSQIAWGALMDSNLQVMTQIFDWISVGALTGPLKNIHLFVPSPLLCSISCVLRVVVMLKGELPSQFELSCRGQHIFVEDFSVFCSIHFPFQPDEYPSLY